MTLLIAYLLFDVLDITGFWPYFGAFCAVDSRTRRPVNDAWSVPLNVDNINRLIEHLKTNFDKVGFNMGSWWPAKIADTSGHGCGTSCCLAGHILLLEPPLGTAFNDHIVDYGGRFLGLTRSLAEQLFIPPIPPSRWYLITPAVAIRVLEILRDEGVVRYYRVLREVGIAVFKHD